MTAPGTRALAKQNKQLRYFTGIACLHGHVSERLTINGTCVECSRISDQSPESRAKAKLWLAANKQRVREIKRASAKRHAESRRVKARALYASSPERREAQQQWVDANRENVRKTKLAWYYRNADREKAKKRAKHAASPELREAKRLYRLAHRDEFREYYREWAKNNRDAIRAHLRNNKAMRKAAPGKHTAADIRRIYAEQCGLCTYCGVEVGDRFHVDHDIPLARGGSNGPENLCIACRPCNTSKQALTGAEFRLRIGGLSETDCQRDLRTGPAPC